jgi:SP family general alpha glucoside:H+ symporter-like MFS transporter
MSSIPQKGNIAEDVLHDQNEALHPKGAASAKMTAENAKADEATRQEHNLSIRAAIKLYYKAIMFSLVLSLAVIMEGYDTSLIGTFFGFTPFLDRYGDEFNPESPRSRIVSARWQTIITVGAQVSNLSNTFHASLVPDYIDVYDLGWQYNWPLR